MGLLVEVIFRGVIQQGLVPVGKACAVQVDAVVHHMLSDAVEGVHQVYPRFADFLVVFPGSGDPLVDGVAGHDAGIAVGDGLQMDGGVGANLLHKRQGADGIRSPAGSIVQQQGALHGHHFRVAGDPVPEGVGEGLKSGVASQIGHDLAIEVGIGGGSVGGAPAVPDGGHIFDPGFHRSIGTMIIRNLILEGIRILHLINGGIILDGHVHIHGAILYGELVQVLLLQSKAPAEGSVVDDIVADEHMGNEAELKVFVPVVHGDGDFVGYEIRVVRLGNQIQLQRVPAQMGDALLLGHPEDQLNGIEYRNGSPAVAERDGAGLPILGDGHIAVCAEGIALGALPQIHPAAPQEAVRRLCFRRNSGGSRRGIGNRLLLPAAAGQQQRQQHQTGEQSLWEPRSAGPVMVKFQINHTFHAGNHQRKLSWLTNNRKIQG